MWELRGWAPGGGSWWRWCNEAGQRVRGHAINIHSRHQPPSLSIYRQPGALIIFPPTIQVFCHNTLIIYWLLFILVSLFLTGCVPNCPSCPFYVQFISLTFVQSCFILPKIYLFWHLASMCELPFRDETPVPGRERSWSAACNSINLFLLHAVSGAFLSGRWRMDWRRVLIGNGEMHRSFFSHHLILHFY